METIYELFTTGVEQLIARTDGPLHFRFILMPIVVYDARCPVGHKGCPRRSPARFCGG
jgi:hypothetical protein